MKLERELSVFRRRPKYSKDKNVIYTNFKKKRLSISVPPLLKSSAILFGLSYWLFLLLLLLFGCGSTQAMDTTIKVSVVDTGLDIADPRFAGALCPLDMKILLVLD